MDDIKPNSLAREEFRDIRPRDHHVFVFCRFRFMPFIVAESAPIT